MRVIEHNYAWHDVHQYWFPHRLAMADHYALVSIMVKWWMQSGATPALERFRPIVEAAKAGQLDHWCANPTGRVSLIVVLDQFSRGLFAGTPQAYASDPHALALAQEGICSGDYGRLASSWEQSFFEKPLIHTEGSDHLKRIDFGIAAAEARLAAAPQHLKRIYEFAVSQSKTHREVIARFGRFPHRNAALNRVSTPEELTYLAHGNLVHERTLSAKA